MFAAWHQHNTIEVATFEHFLPALYAQRDKFKNGDPTTAVLIYDAATMDTAKNLSNDQKVADAIQCTNFKISCIEDEMVVL